MLRTSVGVGWRWVDRCSARGQMGVRSMVAWALVVLVVLGWGTGRGVAQTMAEAPDAGAAKVAGQYKGSVGLGLIGAEIGAVLPALAGAREWWAFVVFPVLGAVGGVLAGHYGLERDGVEPEFSVAALVVGMALVIPATVVTVAATSYERDTELEIGAAERTRKVAAGSGLLRLSERGVFMAAPSVTAGYSLTAREALRTGASRGRVVRVALLSGAF